MDEHYLKLLNELSKDNNTSQRTLSKRLGVSLGKINYVLNALKDKGLVKAKKFKNSANRLGYSYILTFEGIKAKAELTYDFLKVKTNEYETLKKEIEELKEAVNLIENDN